MYEVQEEEAIDFNYGRGELNAGFSSAYMLLYIRADATNDMMAPVSSDDIPKSLINRLSRELYTSRVEQHKDIAMKRAKGGVYASLFTEANLSEFEISTLKLDRRIGSEKNDFHGFFGERRIPLTHTTTMRHMFYTLCTSPPPSLFFYPHSGVNLTPISLHPLYIAPKLCLDYLSIA